MLELALPLASIAAQAPSQIDVFTDAAHPIENVAAVKQALGEKATVRTFHSDAQARLNETLSKELPADRDKAKAIALERIQAIDQSRLGQALAEAYRTWGERVERADRLPDMNALFDQYELEVVPEKAPKTQESKRASIRRLRPVFGAMHPEAIRPKHAYKYHDLVKKKHGGRTARHDIECLRHVLTKAVQWGRIDRNPLLGELRVKQIPSRDRLVEDWEIRECLMMEPKIKSRAVILAKLYVRLKLMTGLRRTDMLRIRLPQIRTDGIHIQPTKTKGTAGKRLIIAWNEAGELRAAVDEVLRLPPRRIGDAPLFVTREGKPYIDELGQANAFDSLWQRFMARVLERTRVTERFCERDLRANVASESDTLIEASERLGHASTEITQRVYRRKSVRVQPLIWPHDE
ncbi:MAG: DUF1525 domain-containing protein [Gammaproteobacteria bacterium]|nr:DUF1525 domain-containing protein [Gammaproteobacteria bacterium]NIR99033.1 DUF1525 domain-containing protein [Gammaproteobacteria bacterium]NIT64659.1 DUF1525 domain-containing protein [Gammaproteobacteria bacterium]NIV21632.1 DUF1525 domain-containing protein [Gammaproteobacteria bacterium]NIY33239.1 DUF1525 domain-containing protein [Gammaproteobacteria bacterium]